MKGLVSTIDNRPQVTNHIVPASEVNRPKSEIKLQQREVEKSRGGQ